MTRDQCQFKACCFAKYFWVVLCENGSLDKICQKNWLVQKSEKRSINEEKTSRYRDNEDQVMHFYIRNSQVLTLCQSPVLNTISLDLPCLLFTELAWTSDTRYRCRKGTIYQEIRYLEKPVLWCFKKKKVWWRGFLTCG